MKKYTYLSLLILFFVGCSQSLTTQKMDTQKLNEMNTVDVLKQNDKLEAKKHLDIYFANTRGKIFYSGDTNQKERLKNQLYIILNNLFIKAKLNKRLPKISREKKLNVAIEINDKSIDKEKLLDIAQNFILKHKRYAISSVDKKTIEIIRKVLKQEKDGLYSGKKKFTTKKRSDVILYLEAKKKNNLIIVTAKLISKNSTLLGIESKEINLNQSLNKEWVEVKVPRRNAPPQTFLVMRYPFSPSNLTKGGSTESLTNVSYNEAAVNCRKINAELITPYVFEAARTSLLLAHPIGIAKSEIIAPFDEEEDDIYIINQNDSLETGDEDIITFRWSDEKYLPVLNIYRSPTLTFRCMKEK